VSVARFPITRERGDAASSARDSSFAVLRHLDYPLLALVVLMAGAGLFVLEGAVGAIPALSGAVDRQATFFWIAVAALVATTLVDYRWLNRGAMAIYAFNIAALLFVLVSGSRIKGAKSWIALGPVNWQPSETMKIATVLVCAQWLALHPETLKSWRGIIVPGAICGIPALLILAQPDLGTASLFFLLFLAMMLVAGAAWSQLGTLLAAACAGMACAFPFLKPYQRARLTSFLDPSADAAGSGYNVIQSKVAIGNGGIFGQGWGAGSQANHRFLPEHHTDFIFASLVEQFGLIGGLVALLLFALLVWRMVRAIDFARDRFGGIAVAGLASLVCGHVVENIGMSMGLLPVTGIPLPFFSYGGSFLVTMFILFGVVLNVSSRRFTFTR